MKFKGSKPEKEATDVTASNQTESSPVTPEASNNATQDQTNSESQSPLDNQAATSADQADQVQATTTAQATAAAPEAATATTSTQTDATSAATTQPDTSAAQAAAYTSSKLLSLYQYYCWIVTSCYELCIILLNYVLFTAQTCTDDGRCAPYTADRCADPWLRENCKSLCKLC